MARSQGGNPSLASPLELSLHSSFCATELKSV
jgi:hypothetical protein